VKATAAERDEGERARPLVGKPEVLYQRLSRDFGDRGVATASFALEGDDELVGQGQCCALHTRIIAYSPDVTPVIRRLRTWTTAADGIRTAVGRRVRFLPPWP
jgi:hypothetical protein